MNSFEAQVSDLEKLCMDAKSRGEIGIVVDIFIFRLSDVYYVVQEFKNRHPGTVVHLDADFHAITVLWDRVNTNTR